MFKIKDEKKACKAELKSIVLNPLVLGGGSKELIYMDSNITLSAGSGVNSMISFQEGFLFGLADGRIGFSNRNKELEFFNLHKGNICAIDASDSIIVTGSWDKTSCILTPCNKEFADCSLNGKYFKNLILNHPESVWSVKIIDNNTIITGCADGIVRLFKNGKFFKELAHHSNAVRSLLVVNDRVISIDNYGKLLKTNFKGEIDRSRDLDEMSFAMCNLNELILIAGENGHIFTINQDLEVLSKIKLPCTTCWNIKADNENVYVCGSNGFCYILEKDQNYDERTVINEVKEEAKEEITEEKAKENNSQDGEFISEGIKYKIEKGKIFREISNVWEFVGDVGKSYDHSFTIELEGKNYTLSFNDSDNSHQIATDFLNKNKMSHVYHQEIVDYIEKNFKKKSKFKLYETINIEGIKKILGDQAPIINTLQGISHGLHISLYKGQENSVYDLENQLKDLPLFIKLDICKYLVFKKIPVDLSFIFKAAINDKKEAKAFVFLMTNLVQDPPFSLNIFYLKIKKLRDLGLLTLNDIVSFENNLEIRNKK